MFQRRNNFGRSEVFDSGPRLTQLLFAGFISGLAAAALFFLVSYFALRLRHASNSEPLDLFLKGVCSTSFRESILGLEGALASFAVALAAFTWMERRRPGDPNRVRVWLKQVVSDAKREEICFISAMLLVMLFGASAWAFFFECDEFLVDATLRRRRYFYMPCSVRGVWRTSGASRSNAGK